MCFLFRIKILSLVLTGLALSATGRDEPWLWHGWVQRHCWVGSGQYIFHHLSRLDCRADVVAAVAHWFGNVGLWEATVACAVGESFERHRRREQER